MIKTAQNASPLVHPLGTNTIAPCANQGNTSISLAGLHRFKKAVRDILRRFAASIRALGVAHVDVLMRGAAANRQPTGRGT